MTVFCLGSINADHVYRVPHLPGPGETLAADEISTGLGGKGANQSIAAARAGAPVVHIGAVGQDGLWARDALADEGIDATTIAVATGATGHAVIQVDPAGENTIVIHPGANRKQSLKRLKAALSEAGKGDILLLQNETDLQPEAARLAKNSRAFVIYSAAPFDVDAVREMLDHIDLLVMNAVEAEQLTRALGNLPVQNLLVTLGADGAEWHAGGMTHRVPAFSVNPVDTTGAGDCFIGYVAAGLHDGMDREAAMRLGSAAAALQVTRIGASAAIPQRADVDAFLIKSGD